MLFLCPETLSHFVFNFAALLFFFSKFASVWPPRSSSLTWASSFAKAGFYWNRQNVLPTLRVQSKDLSTRESPGLINASHLFWSMVSDRLPLDTWSSSLHLLALRCSVQFSELFLFMKGKLVFFSFFFNTFFSFLQASFLCVIVLPIIFLPFFTPVFVQERFSKSNNSLS